MAPLAQAVTEVYLTVFIVATFNFKLIDMVYLISLQNIMFRYINWDYLNFFILRNILIYMKK